MLQSKLSPSYGTQEIIPNVKGRLAALRTYFTEVTTFNAVIFSTGDGNLNLVPKLRMRRDGDHIFSKLL